MTEQYNDNSLKLDDDLTTYILDNTTIFENINPNYITIFGILLNFAILFLMLHPTNLEYTHTIIIIFILLFLRYLADILDGGIARKYKKSSYIGGVLDSISDQILIIIVLWYMATLFNMSYNWLLLYVILATYITIATDSLSDHANLKDSRAGLWIIPFLINNSFIPYSIFFLIYANTVNI